MGKTGGVQGLACLRRESVTRDVRSRRIQPKLNIPQLKRRPPILGLTQRVSQYPKLHSGEERVATSSARIGHIDGGASIFRRGIRLNSGVFRVAQRRCDGFGSPPAIDSSHLLKSRGQKKGPLAAGLFDALVCRDQPSTCRAFLNMRIHGLSSGQPAGAQLRLAVRRVRSGCGIRIVARPSDEVRPAIASSEPLGLAGYASAGTPSPST